MAAGLRRRLRRWCFRAGIAAGAALTAGTLSGCLRSPLRGRTPINTFADDPSWRVDDAPRVPVPRGPAGCGAQALAGALSAPGDGPRERAALAASLPWHDTGATPVDLLLAARAHGAAAEIVTGDPARLAAELGGQSRCLVMIDAGLEVRSFSGRTDLPMVMHWALVVGLQPATGDILVAAPDATAQRIAADDFARRWARSDRCLLVITPRSRELARRSAAGPSPPP